MIVGFFVLIGHLLIKNSDVVHQFDYKLYDFIATKIHSNELNTKKSHTILVDIDEKSLKALGQWPWPRIVMADLVQKIDSYHPSAIGLDIIFPEEDRTSPKLISLFYKQYFHFKNDVITVPDALADNDVIFENILKSTKSTIGINLSHTRVNYNECNISSSIIVENSTLRLNSYQYALCNTPKLQNNSNNFGFVNATPDSDGVVRRMPLLQKYKEEIVPSFSLALLSMIDSNIKINDNKFTILDHTITTDNDSSFLLHFYKGSWYKKVSAYDVLQGRVNPKNLSGKIVLIGSSAVGLHDQLVRTGGIKTIGSIVHMTMIDNLVENKIIVQPSIYKYINLVISSLLALLSLYLLIKNKNMLVVSTILVSVTIYIFLTYYMLVDGVYISSAYFYLPFMLSFMFISITFMIIDSYNKRLFVEELDRSHVALLDSMVHVAEVHDIETGAHILRTKKYIRLLGEHILKQPYHPYFHQLSKLKIEMMYRTAPLHDIGKVGIPDSVLKKPGKLTFLEYEVMKTHPDLGRHIIKNAMNSYEENDFFTMATNIAYTHHEKWDGSGYPEGLEGKDIPLEGRFMAIADVYDALVNQRVYKKAFSYDETYRIMKEGRGKHFDPLLVDAFFEIKEALCEISEAYVDDLND